MHLSGIADPSPDARARQGAELDWTAQPTPAPDLILARGEFLVVPSAGHQSSASRFSCSLVLDDSFRSREDRLPGAFVPGFRPSVDQYYSQLSAGGQAVQW